MNISVVDNIVDIINNKKDLPKAIQKNKFLPNSFKDEHIYNSFLLFFFIYLFKFVPKYDKNFESYINDFKEEKFNLYLISSYFCINKTLECFKSLNNNKLPIHFELYIYYSNVDYSIQLSFLLWNFKEDKNCEISIINTKKKLMISLFVPKDGLFKPIETMKDDSNLEVIQFKNEILHKQLLETIKNIIPEENENQYIYPLIEFEFENENYLSDSIFEKNINYFDINF